jgi:hypothetical protein
MTAEKAELELAVRRVIIYTVSSLFKPVLTQMSSKWCKICVRTGIGVESGLCCARAWNFYQRTVFGSVYIRSERPLDAGHSKWRVLRVDVEFGSCLKLGRDAT